MKELGASQGWMFFDVSDNQTKTEKLENSDI